jgi:hypothetical protein
MQMTDQYFKLAHDCFFPHRFELINHYTVSLEQLFEPVPSGWQKASTVKTNAACSSEILGITFQTT